MEKSSGNQRETNPNQASHQQETVPHGSEGGTATDTIPNPSVTTRSSRNIQATMDTIPNPSVTTRSGRNI